VQGVGAGCATQEFRKLLQNAEISGLGAIREAEAETGVACSAAWVTPVKSCYDAVPTCDFDPYCCRFQPARVSQVSVPISYGLASRESFSAEATGVLSRACGEAASADGRCQALISALVPMV
jgi:hypothetical protein